MILLKTGKKTIIILKTADFIGVDFFFTKISDHFNFYLILYSWRKCWIFHRISFTFKEAVSSFPFLEKYIIIGNMQYFLMHFLCFLMSGQKLPLTMLQGFSRCFMNCITQHSHWDFKLLVRVQTSEKQSLL